MELAIYEAFREAGIEEKAAIKITRSLIAAINEAVERRFSAARYEKRRHNPINICRCKSVYGNSPTVFHRITFRHF